ncbi:carbohydrate kinase family protein [Luteipulveratus sp. YIM 133132]|uniref:Carbohydrate kinase family protein n=1 Tax=Luteipulveratus flavus TaxID=3031728 RepID=A0ABT6C6X2_9MICO|nr:MULTISPECIES: carbohydrate kinase family protein [unclassified Luteipulveratus]MDE9366412.1 carbohydrate kinase family protein [Luteipulveratus sp. YIM 133132]MDF8264313.1 carbohydrate kinase family protein [Luteipulveratus sp. YIM 133296]
MNIAITGSIATDHLMTFQGRFADSLVVEQLDKISLSFLADDLQIRRGGVAANIAFGMANLGLRPVLVGAVGEDFVDYRSWLERHGVDCDSVHVSGTKHTARFVCTTDEDMAQIATFYAGAMSEARDIELAPVAARVGGLDLVLIGANDPEGMRRHTQECRTRGIPFIADPSQQLAFSDGPFIQRLIDGAQYLFTNEYEAHLTEQKTGWSGEEILDRVGTRVITQGKDGAVILRKGEPEIHVPVAGEVKRADPTGVGDAFRAGFLAGLSWDLDLRRCAEVGSMLATYVIETIGTQEYVLHQSEFLQRIGEAYGPEAGAAIEPHLACLRR